MRCCAEDEGVVALRSRPAGGGVKPPRAALVEDFVNMNAELSEEWLGVRGAVRVDGGNSGPPKSSCGRGLQTTYRGLG